MIRKLLWVLFILCGGLSLANPEELLWDRADLQFEARNGKDRYEIDVNRGINQSYSLEIWKNTQLVVDEKDIQPGKGDLEGTQVLQFDIRDNPYIRSLIIYQDGEKLSCRLDVIVGVPGRPRK